MVTGALTVAEEELVVILGEAWNAFLSLPTEGEHDNREFMDAIHRAQALVLMRPGRRQMYQKARTPNGQ